MTLVEMHLIPDIRSADHTGKFEDCLAMYYISVLLLRDFNFLNVGWPGSQMLPEMTHYQQALEESLLQLTNASSMEQIVLQSTRTNDILDLFFASDMDILHNVKVSPTLISDQNILELCLYEAKVLAEPILSNQTVSKLNFHKSN